MKLRNKIYQISGAEYGELGSAFAIQHDSGIVLIDSSSHTALEIMLDNLRYWGLKEQDVTHVLITHGHDDHCGCAAYFQKAGAKICIGAEDCGMLERGNLGDDSPCTNHFMPSCKPDYLFEKDEVITIGAIDVHIIKMPGHTDGNVVFYMELDGELVLFSGDTFYPHGERGELASTGWKGDLSYNSKKLGESFAKLYALNLKPDMVFSSHGIPLYGKKANDCIRVAYKYHLLNNR